MPTTPHPKRDFVRYVQAFEHFFEKNCITCMSPALKTCPHDGTKITEDTCPVCGTHVDSIVVEPYISKLPCDVCGDPQQGDREDYIAFNASVPEDDPHRILDLVVCEDCVYYNERHVWPDDRADEVDKDVTDAWLRDGTKVALFGPIEHLTCQAVVGTGKETVELLNIDTNAWEE